MNKQYLFWLIVLITFSATAGEAAKPKWVKKRPSERDYYVGIGMAVKDKSEGLDYAKKARADALKEMASEIEVNISSNSLFRKFENNYDFRETYESEVATSTTNSLQGYEVKTWENKREYWVLMRLNKEEYQRRKRQDLQMAKKQAASYLFDARKHVKEKQISAALASYFKAIESLEDHVKDDLTYKSIEGNINFATDIMQDLRELFSQITITPENRDYIITFSKNMETPLKAGVKYYPPGGPEVPVKNFPVKFEFIRGSGILQKKGTTNPGGIVSNYIQRLESSRKQQEVMVSFDHTVLLKDENIESPLISFFLPEENIPKTRFNIELQKSKAWFTATETVFGSNNRQHVFSNNLKSRLNETFFNFTHAPQDAEYIVEIKANFKRGEVREGEGYTVYLVFADLYMTISSTKTQTEIFNTVISEVKGMRPGSYDYALKEAREKLLKRFREEVYPQLESANF